MPQVVGVANSPGLVQATMGAFETQTLVALIIGQSQGEATQGTSYEGTS